jgi:hypothetical protein
VIVHPPAKPIVWASATCGDTRRIFTPSNAVKPLKATLPFIRSTSSPAVSSPPT